MRIYCVMELLRISSILCLIAVACCQEGDTSSPTSIDVTDATTTASPEDSSSPSSTEHDVVTVTKGDMIFTREETTVDDFSIDLNVTSSTLTSSLSLEITTTDMLIDSSWTACTLNPCKNGGVCLLDPFNQHVYSCMCKSGYNGNRCGVKDDCSIGENEIVCNKGACVYSKDGSSRSCDCFFGEYWDELKKECREAEAPCFPNPCFNGGKCTKADDGSFKCECSSGYDGTTCEVRNKCGEGDTCGNGTCTTNEEGDLKFCSCNANLYWNEDTKTCEDEVPPCIPNPCENNGQCEVLPSGDFNCSCSGHYIGKKCTVPNICYSPDDDGVVCGGHGNCEVSENSTKCICDNGYYLDEEMHVCRAIVKPCFPNPCANDGLCMPFDSKNFNCTCSEGYTGTYCEELDLCTLQGGNAACGVDDCESDQNLDIFYCQCTAGHYFDFNKMACVAIDLCPLMSCEANEKCVDSKCECQPNYKLNNNTGKCEAHFCASNPCPLDELICTEGDGIKDYYCSCKEGFAFDGMNCHDAVCALPDFNDCQQLCETAKNGYSCKCFEDHFKLKEDNKTCVYNGNSTCSNKTCEKGTCLKDGEEERCICRPAYEEVEGKCVDKCTSGHLPDGYCPGNQCEVTTSGFRCKCEGKYVLSEDKVTCTTRRMCEKGEAGWTTCAAKNATCVENWTNDIGFDCFCSFPQVKSKQGVCQDICSNEEYQRECSALGAKCDVSMKGEKICRCPPLYQKPRNSESCSKQSDFSYLLTIPLDLDSYKSQHSSGGRTKRSLESNPFTDYFRIKTDIERAMTKIFPELIQINLLTCKENKNYYSCKTELQFQSITADDLKRIKVPGICLTNKESDDNCLIPPSLVLRKDRLKNDLMIQKTDPCDEDVKADLCGSETACTTSDSNKFFNCTCSSGYEMRDKKFLFADSNSFIEICNDVDECSEMNACPQHTTCHNTIGSYSCSCVAGYRNKDKSSDPKVDGCIAICNPNPCDHGSCEEKGDHDFECRCEAGFSGALCDLTDENFKHARTNTIIVGAVLGGALLVLIIIFITTVSRLKKKKYEEEPDHMLYAAEMVERRGGAVNNAYQRE